MILNFCSWVLVSSSKDSGSIFDVEQVLLFFLVCFGLLFGGVVWLPLIKHVSILVVVDSAPQPLGCCNPCWGLGMQSHFIEVFWRILRCCQACFRPRSGGARRFFMSQPPVIF